MNLALTVYNLGIAEDIQKAACINNTFAFRYVKQLMDDYGMSRVNADWIVSVWCACYGGKVLGKACDISVQKQGSGPAIQGEQATSGKSYGDLFTYEKSRRGNGLAVTGFRGEKNQTIIFQNRSGNAPVIEIADNSFSNVPIEEAILTEGISYIGRNAFSECKNLHQVVLPISVEEVEDSAFEDCTSLKKVQLHEKLGVIGERAFFGCSSLDFIIIPDSVEQIGQDAFANTDKQFIIQCSFGSYAEEYARKNKFKYQLV